MRKEDQEQKLVIQWARIQSRAIPELELLYHIPNESKRPVVTAAYLKSMGMLPGIPDLCLPVPRGKYAALYIEMKSDSGRVSDQQKDIICKLGQAGNCAIICRSADGAIAAIRQYLAEGKG